MDDVTIDSMFQGRLQVKQMRRGYRFSIDAVIVAHFAGPLVTERVLDLGTGCGIIPLILAYRYPRISVYGVEIQQALARLAEDNISRNGMSDRVRIHRIDMKRLTREVTSGPVDLVIGNPPFHPLLSGRLNPGSQRAIARHELMVTLSDLLESTAGMLRPGGRFVAVYPADRKEHMLSEMGRNGIAPKAVRMVHSRENGPSKLFLVEGVKGNPSDLTTGPPMVLYRASGEYTHEVANMFLP